MYSSLTLSTGASLHLGTYFMLYDYLSYFNKDESTSLTREQLLEIIGDIFKEWSPAERESIIFQVGWHG